MPSYNEIDLTDSDKKIFKVFYTDKYGKLAPLHGGHVFLTNPNGLNNLGRGSPFLPSYIAIGPVVSDKKIFLSFLYRLYRENMPRHLAAMFFDESKLLEQSW